MAKRLVPSQLVGELCLMPVTRPASFRAAMKKGRHGERYLLGSVNWTFNKFFGRLERLTKNLCSSICSPFTAGHYGLLTWSTHSSNNGAYVAGGTWRDRNGAVLLVPQLLKSCPGT